MKVLHITTMYPGPADPMSGIFIHRQIESMQKAGVECDVLPLTYAQVRSPRVWREVSERVEEGGCDLVHCHYGYSLLAALAVRSVPLVVSYCGTDVMGGGGTLEKKVKHAALVLISNLLSRRAAAVIAKAERLRARLWFNDVRQRCVVIPNGVDLQIFQPVERDEACVRTGLEPAKHHVLFAGNYDKYVKRIDIVEAAMDEVRAADPDCELLKIRGVESAELNLYYSACDCLVLASEHEGSPNVVKEAMACNLPIVSVDVGDVREIVGDTPGCVLVERRPDSMAAGILAALEFGRRTDGRARVEPLEAGRIAERIIAVYENTLKSGRK